MQTTCTSWAGLAIMHYSSCSTDQLTRHRSPGIKPAKNSTQKNALLCPWLFAAAYTQHALNYFAFNE
jgi:hypothetical protein